jgi:hypothetical protein
MQICTHTQAIVNDGLPGVLKGNLTVLVDNLAPLLASVAPSSANALTQLG